MLRIAIVMSLLPGCLQDDCRVGAWRCIGDELQSCEAHGGGLYGPIDDPSYVHSSSPTWEDNTACGANLCISSDKAFCALAATRESACGASGYACAGDTLVECRDGYATSRTACLACDATKGSCSGSMFDVCATATDCAPGMTCTNQGCELPCACPEGASCGVCDAAFEESPDPSNGVWRASTCRAGFCD
ncbi:MAG: hypothetical protein ABI591_21785 [Kofleriaceae bacterium]